MSLKCCPGSRFRLLCLNNTRFTCPDKLRLFNIGNDFMCSQQVTGPLDVCRLGFGYHFCSRCLISNLRPFFGFLVQKYTKPILFLFFLSNFKVCLAIFNVLGKFVSEFDGCQIIASLYHQICVRWNSCL